MSPQTLPNDAIAIAAAWRAQLANADHGPVNLPLAHTDANLTIAALAEFVALTLASRETLLIVLANDQWLPEISNALDLALRPLCLVLPAPGFAADITLRATLSLLKSRLSRGSEACSGGAWDDQRSRLEQHADLWQTALDWRGQANPDTNRPQEVGNLFPICFLVGEQSEILTDTPRDILLIAQPQRLSVDLRQRLSFGKRTLLLQEAAPASGLVWVDAESRLKADFEMLAQELGEMELEFATVQGELAEFTRTYHLRVGSRMIELDALQARIARCLADSSMRDAAAQQQARQAEAQADQSKREHRRFTELDREIEKPFMPSADLKRLFRQLAQKIHPDRAVDEADRAWRSELMSEANRAYRAGDEMVLHEILSQWQTGQSAQIKEPVRPQGLALQIARMQERLAAIEAELNRLIASRLYELFAAANLARQQGRDLLQELVEQLDAQIAAARLHLEQLEAA